jgi:hypothetical protein
MDTKRAQKIYKLRQKRISWLIGEAGGGVWETNDDGTTWAPRTGPTVQDNRGDHLRNNRPAGLWKCFAGSAICKHSDSHLLARINFGRADC